MANTASVISGLAKGNIDSGWYVAVAVIGSIALSSTPLSPVLFAIDGVALIVQLNNFLKKGNL